MRTNRVRSPALVVYVRMVKTASGATAVQIGHSSRRGSRDIEHVGSAHDAEEVEALRAVARQRMAEGQAELDLGLSVAEAASSGGPLEIASSRMGDLWDALCRAYDVLGSHEAAGGDEVFRQLVLARIIEPTSKQDSVQVLAETGIKPNPKGRGCGDGESAIGGGRCGMWGDREYDTCAAEFG